LDGDIYLREAHDIAEEIIESLTIIFPKAEIIIHQDPVGNDERVDYREEFKI
jgi:divalent metal cation (Fe/Co/Zn/Cd) transporter